MKKNPLYNFLRKRKLKIICEVCQTEKQQDIYLIQRKIKEKIIFRCYKCTKKNKWWKAVSELKYYQKEIRNCLKISHKNTKKVRETKKEIESCKNKILYNVGELKYYQEQNKALSKVLDKLTKKVLKIEKEIESYKKEAEKNEYN